MVHLDYQPGSMVGNIWPREFTWFDRLRTLPLPDAGKFLRVVQLLYEP